MNDRFRDLVELIRRNEPGRRGLIDTPFGRRRITYADLTATGRHLDFVDEWIRQLVPFYANTHTEVSSTGRLLTELRESAREIVRRAVHAGDDDEVIFVGSGATAAVNKLVGLLGLGIDEPLDRAYKLSERIPPDERALVLVGPYEHHSNLLPWLESTAELIEIELDDEGRIDLELMRRTLRTHQQRKLIIGSFSAASNVTGMLSDVRGITRVLHDAGALAFFDYAAAGPYVPIDIRPGPPEERIDAVFLSLHKFVGGPEGSGVLIANRRLFRTTTPERPGGGTVAWVAGTSRDTIDYLDELAAREEGGTPAIFGDLRAGAAFLVKEMLGPERLLEHELKLAERVINRLSRHPRINILGPTRLPRLAIVSFTISDLHHDLVSVLLDHLFGIQNRAGCACAGPYGHRLLGVSRRRSKRYRDLMQRGLLAMKPGWVRLSFPYYASEEEIEFILSAVELVADHGIDFVPVYRMGWSDGVWRHVDGDPHPAPRLVLTTDALAEAARRSEERTAPEPEITDERIAGERAGYLQHARELAGRLHARWQESPLEWNRSTGDRELDELVWFRYVQTDRRPS